MERNERKRVIEAALFVSGKPLPFQKLSEICQCSELELQELLNEMKASLSNNQETSLYLDINDDEKNAGLYIKTQFLSTVSTLAKVNLTRKALKILALVAKKQVMRQSELHNYFKGDIYEYVSELKELGYITATKDGQTKKLKTTPKFREEFQFSDKLQKTVSIPKQSPQQTLQQTEETQIPASTPVETEKPTDGFV